MNTTPRIDFTGSNTHLEPLNLLLTDPTESEKEQTRVLSEAELRTAFLIGEGIGAEWVKALRRLLKIEDLSAQLAAQEVARTYRRVTVYRIAEEVERARNAVSFKPMLYPLLQWDDPCGASLSYSVQDEGRAALVTGRIKGNMMLRQDRTGVFPRAPLWMAWINTKSGDTMLSVMPATAHKDEACLEDWWQPVNKVLMVWGHPSRKAPRRRVLHDRS